MKFKRAGAFLLSLVILLAGCTACKPDNIAPPAEILDPGQGTVAPVEEQTPAENNVTPTPAPTAPAETPEPAENPEGSDDSEPQNRDEPAPVEETEPAGTEEVGAEPAETPDGEAPAEQSPFAPIALAVNPLEQADFAPSAETGNTLPVSGFIKNSAAAVFQDQVFRIITGDDAPAFQYADKKGKAVTEWEWLRAICEKNGAKLKITVKNADLSVKAQRVALYAGLPLSLVQLSGSDLGTGLTLTSRVKEEETDAATEPFGISKAVFNASGRRLFAPRGLFASLWYDDTELTGELAPKTAADAGNWTLTQYAAAYNDAVRRELKPLALDDPLVWATVGGISPLTLLNDKLDHNIHARAVREVWTALRATNETLSAFTPNGKTVYSLAEDTLAMEYTDLPVAAKNQTLQWIGLPALAEGGENPVTFTGRFLALPRYGQTEEQRLAALVLAELWCNRYTETRAADLAALGVSGAAYADYAAYGEAHGYLILHNAAIEKYAAPYLAGLTDYELDMEDVWTTTCRNPIDHYIETQNLYY